MAVLFPATAFFHGTKISNKKPLPNSFFFIGFSVSCTLYPTNPCMLSSPLRRNRRLYLPFPCRAAKPGHTPPPPQSDPPPGSPRISGLLASLSKFQDRIQIFFAVLFWMSLFFWTCAWDESNRPNKGPRFRR